MAKLTPSVRHVRMLEVLSGPVSFNNVVAGLTLQASSTDQSKSRDLARRLQSRLRIM